MAMITPASIQAAVDVVVKFAAAVGELERAVTRLEIAEKHRLQQLQLTLWDHRSAPSNGHGKGL
jgi:hypothetical protein